MVSKGEVAFQEYERLKKLNVRALIRNFFTKVNGDYDNPTNESLLNVLDELKEFADNFPQTKKKSVIRDIKR